MIIPFFSSSSQSRKGPNPNGYFSFPWGIQTFPCLIIAVWKIWSKAVHWTVFSAIYKIWDWQLECHQRLTTVVLDIQCQLIKQKKKFFLNKEHKYSDFCLFIQILSLFTSTYPVPDSVFALICMWGSYSGSAGIRQWWVVSSHWHKHLKVFLRRTGIELVLGRGCFHRSHRMVAWVLWSIIGPLLCNSVRCFFSVLGVDWVLRDWLTVIILARD